MAKSKHQAVNDALNKKKSKQRTGPLWRLEQGITYSALDCWLDNPEEFGLKYIDGYTSKSLKGAMEFGSMFHHCVEYQDKFTDALQAAITVTEKYKRFRAPSLTNTTDRDALDRLIRLCVATYPHYREYWRADDDAIDWIGREEKFSIPYSLPYEGGAARQILLNGMRDGLYRLNGKLGIFETKTKSRISEDEILDGLKADTQTMIYVVATYMDTGEAPKEVTYNVIRRSGLTVRKNDTLADWQKRVDEDIRSRPDYYFKRYIVELTQNDIDTFITQTLNPQLRLFVQWWDSIKKDPSRAGRFQSPYHHLNCKNLIGKYGKSDMFDAIMGNHRNYYQRSATFPELEPLDLLTLQN